MERVKKLPVKIKINDEFDYPLFMRGMIYQTMNMHGNIYEFKYYFTFKRTKKAYSRKYYHPYLMPMDDDNFYFDTGDQVVRNCCHVVKRIREFQIELCNIFAINLKYMHRDKVAISQSKRFEPYRLLLKKSKGYKRLMVYYERALVEYIQYLFKVACAITASNYSIPQVLSKQFLKEESVSLWLLNTDNDVVMLIKELIEGLRADLKIYKEVSIENKILRRKPVVAKKKV